MTPNVFNINLTVESYNTCHVPWNNNIVRLTPANYADLQEKSGQRKDKDWVKKLWHEKSTNKTWW